MTLIAYVTRVQIDSEDFSWLVKELTLSAQLGPRATISPVGMKRADEAHYLALLQVAHGD